MLKELKTLLPFFRAFRRQYGAGLACLVIADAGQLAIPQVVRRVVDLVSSGRFRLEQLLPYMGWLIGLAAVIASSRFGWRYFIHGSSRRIEKQLRERLYLHLQTLSSSFYGRVKTGDLMSHFTNDMNAVRMGTGMAIVAFMDGFFMTLAILVILLSENPVLTLLAVSPLPLITAGIIFFGKLVGERFRRVQEGFSAISDMAQESLSGIRVIKTFVQEKPFVRRFDGKNLDYSQRNLSLVRLWGFFYPAVSFLAGITSLIFLILGGREVMEGRLSAGELTAFFSYLQMLIWPMLGAGFTINMLQRAAASLGRINKLLDEKPDIASPPPRPLPAAATTAPGRALSLEFRDLGYTYPGAEEPALQGIRLAVPAGGFLGILGPTAAGKSTLLRLVPRLLDPPPGTLFLDGIDVRDYDLRGLRSLSGMVPQDSFLFSQSIRANIAFGSCDGDDELVRRSAVVSTIDRDWRSFPLGWDTVVGERGITLSGGQKQRVALARALAAEAAITLLDDSFSAVDTETEDAILNALLPLLAGRTLILVSHRISTLKRMQRIVVLEEGRITQEGTHEELMEAEGYYARIAALQHLEEEMRKKP